MEKRNFNPVTQYTKDHAKYSDPGTYIEEVPLINPNIIPILEKELGYPFSGVRVNLPFCLHLEDGYYPVRLKGLLNIVYNQKILREEIPYFGGTANNVEMLRDPKGLFRYSRFEIFFKSGYLLEVDKRSVKDKVSEMVDTLELVTLRELSVNILPNIVGKKLSIEKKQNLQVYSFKILKNQVQDKVKNLTHAQLKELYTELRFLIFFNHVRTVINRFVNVYRIVTNSYYLPNFKRSDIACWMVTDFLKEREHKSQLHSLFVNPISFLIPDRPTTEHEVIWDALDKEIPISLDSQMAVSAQRFIIEENTSLAVVEAFSAFEILIHQCLQNRLTLNGMSQTDINELLNKDRNWQISERVAKLFKNYIGTDLVKSSHYSGWNDAKKLRDEIIHSGKRDVTYSESKVAVDSITAFMNEIQRIYNPY